jgi:chloramphenicol-sensitive protein RarD
VVLMILSGVFTALPLLLFAAAAQRLPLVTMGLLFYLTPAMQLTWGVLVGHEPMPPARWLGFALIGSPSWCSASTRCGGRGPPRRPTESTQHRETPDSSARLRA